MAKATEGSANSSESEKHGDTIVRGAAFTLAAKVASGAFTAALTVFLARRLGVAQYGLLALAMSVIALVELPSDFGVSNALTRFLAEHRSEPKLMSELAADAIRLEMLGTLVVAAVLAALAGFIAHAYGAPRLEVPLRILAISIVGQNFLFLFTSVFSALRRQAFNLWATTLESVVEFSVSVALVLLVGGASAAALGRVIGYAVGAAVGLVLVIRLLGTEILPVSVSTHGHARQLAGYARTLWIVDGVFTVFVQIDALLIGAILTVGSVALFQAPMRLITIFQYPGYAIASAVAPRLVRSRDHTPDVRAFEHSVRLLMILMVACAVFTTVWATPLIHFTLGSGYGKAAPVLRALGPYVFLNGLSMLVAVGLNYLGNAGRRVPIALATVLLNVVVDVLLIPRIGVVGGAIGSDAGYAIYVIAQFGFVLSLLGLTRRPYVLMFLRCAVAGVPMAAVLAVFGTGPLGVPAALAGVIAGLGVYGLALLLVREVTSREVRLAVARARRGWRR